MYELKQMAQKCSENPKSNVSKAEKCKTTDKTRQNFRKNHPSKQRITKTYEISKAQKTARSKKSKQNTGKRKSEGKRLSNRPSKHSVGAKRTFKNVKHLLSPSSNATRALFLSLLKHNERQIFQKSAQESKETLKRSQNVSKRRRPFRNTTSNAGFPLFEITRSICACDGDI